MYYNEQASTDAFERMVGGVSNAQRMLRLYSDSYPSQGAYLFERYSKADNFRKRAKAEGFTDRQIKAFLDLQ